MTEPPPRVCVLTGAGASKPLGLPTMESLLPEGFERSLPDRSGERDVFDMAVNWAALQNPTVLDFEYVFTLVDTVARLQPSDPIAMAFAARRKDAGAFQFRQAGGTMIEANLDGYRKDAAALAEKLKEVVHDQLIVRDTARAGKLYQGLFTFLSSIVGSTGQLDLFTTNYDRGVEASYEIPAEEPAGFDFELVRGFTQGARARAPQWDPGVYERPSGSRFIVKLYKLHGSLDWRRENDTVLQVAADEYVGRNVVIYPVGKPSIEEPFKTLFRFFQQRLEESDVCVVIGSSLRDEYIRRVLIERVRADALRLVLVDPNADQLASLLAPDLGPDALARLVQTANVHFGGSAEEQNDMEGKIRSAAIQAKLPPASSDTSGSR